MPPMNGWGVPAGAMDPGQFAEGVAHGASDWQPSFGVAAPPQPGVPPAAGGVDVCLDEDDWKAGGGWFF